LRTFIALNLQPGEKQELHQSLEALRRRDLPVRWTAGDSLHLTLKFLGAIEGGEVPRIEDALRSAAENHGPVELELGGFGAFPSLRRASVLWVGVAPAQPLMSLQRELELAFSRLGYAREQKPFRPHITVARLRSGARPPDVERLAGEYDYHSRVTIASMELMRSHTMPSGQRYEPLLRSVLGGPVAP
jgi:RNA 2',3'-cyclic 3'-phosphodiesterase